MQKKMNMGNTFEKCRICDCEKNTLTAADNAMKVIEISEDLIRSVLVDLLDASRLLVLEKIEKTAFEEKIAVMIVMDREGDFLVITEDEVEEKYPDKEFSEVAVISDGQLIAAFDPDDVVTLGDADYLIGPMLIYEIDENGNDVDIDKDTIGCAVDYAFCNEVEICVDDQNIPAFRLI
ncbi:MAG: hypothetical protein MR283_06145 [Erysipelotrichaceae bacterium]|nr:hypothetical protein [Erysipelotrichaceae bacterium]